MSSLPSPWRNCSYRAIAASFVLGTDGCSVLFGAEDCSVLVGTGDCSVLVGVAGGAGDADVVSAAAGFGSSGSHAVSSRAADTARHSKNRGEDTPQASQTPLTFR